MAISEYNYIPTYIKRTIANKPKDVITHSYWNELFNLLITQGDHTAEELGNILNHFTAAINEVKGIADGKYVKPTNGIPKTDLAAAVQTSLDKADTALQTHQSLAAYRTAFAQDVIDSDLGDRISAIEGKEAGWNGKQDKLTAGNNITIAADGTISSTGGGAKVFFLDVFVITETEVITNKTYAEIKAAIDAGDIIYITDKNGIVYVPQVGTTNTKIELLWIESQGNRTLYWTAVVDSENAWSAAEFELVEIDKLVFELSDKVDKETGKGLSTNDYTYADKAKVDAIPANPKYTDTVYDDTALKERVATIEGKESAWDAKSDFSGSYNDLTDKPTIPTEVTPLIGTTSTLTPAQVYNAVSAGIPVKVQYTDRTYGLLSFTAFNVAESLNVVVSQTIVYYNSVYILAELFGNKSNNSWGFMTTTLAQKTDIPSSLKNPNALIIEIGSTTVTYDGSTEQVVTIDDGTEVSY